MIEFILFAACAFIFFKLGCTCERIRQGVKASKRDPEMLDHTLLSRTTKR